MKHFISFLIMLFLSFTGRSLADKIILNNGAVFEGKITVDTDKLIKININSSGTTSNESSIEMSFTKDRIKKVERTGIKAINNSVHVDTKPEKENKNSSAPKNETPAKTNIEKENTSKTPAKTSNIDSNKEDKSEEKEKELTWDPEIERLISKLDTDKESILSKYRSQIKAYGKEAVPPLIKTFRSGTIVQKKEAAYLLGEIKDKRSTAALIRTLNHPFSLPSVSRQAAYSLKKITGRNYYFKHDATPLRRKKYIDRWKEWFADVKDKDEYKDQINLDIKDSASGKTKPEDTKTSDKKSTNRNNRY